MKRFLLTCSFVLFIYSNAFGLSFVYDSDGFVTEILDLEYDGCLFDVEFIESTFTNVPGVGIVSQQLSVAPDIALFDISISSYVSMALNSSWNPLIGETSQWVRTGSNGFYTNIYSDIGERWMTLNYTIAPDMRWRPDSPSICTELLPEFESVTALLALIKPQNAAPVPEPSTILLMGSMIIGYIGKRKFSKSK